MTDAAPPTTLPGPGGPPRAALRVLFGIVLLDLLGFGILVPQLGVYGVKYGASPLTAGLLLSVYSLAQLVAAPWLGRLSDRYGRRPVLLLSLAGSALGYGLFALAHALPLLFLSRVVDGLSGGNISTAQAYVADVTTPEERPRAMGLVGAAFGLGFILGPAVGGLLGAWGGNLAIGLFAAGLSALNLAFAWRLLPESRRPGGPAAEARSVRGLTLALAVPGLGGLLALALLFTLAFSAMEGTFSVFLLSRFVGHGPVQVTGDGLFTLHAHAAPEALAQASLRTGGLFALVGVLSALIQGGVFRRLLERVLRRPVRADAARLARAGVAVTGVGLVLVPWAPSYGALFLPMGLLAVGSAFFQPSLSALVSLRAPEGRRGAVLGAYQAMGALGRIGGPALGGLLFTGAGPAAPYLGGAALLALALVTSVRALRPQSP